MIRSEDIYIFLKDRQPVLESETARTIYILETPELVITEETLAPGSFKEIAASGILLVPVVGTLKLTADGKKIPLDCGKIYLLNNGQNYSIGNDYEEDLVKFILIVQTSFNFKKVIESHLLSLMEKRNQLFTAFEADSIKISASQIEMRQESEYNAQKEGPLFFYVLQGSAEIEGRLLHEGDGLLINGYKRAEIESLGTNTILFIIETF